MIPDWAMRLPLNLIYTKANDFSLDAFLIAAICWTESSGFVYAVRYEPNYRWLFKVEKFAGQQKITVTTEETLQKQSYGLVQIMGATARWLGYSGALPALYKPENNLYWGCRYLKYLTDKYDDLASVVSAYNAGSPRKAPDGRFVNQEYVDKVLGYYKQLVAS